MSLGSTNQSVPQTPDMASSVPVVDTGRKRKHEDGSNDAVLKHSDCESDSDSDFACEAPDGGDPGKRLQSGIRPLTYLKSSSGINSSSTKGPSNDRETQNTVGSNNVPKVSVDESESDSDGEEAAEVEEVEPTISCVKVTSSSDTNRSIAKPAPSLGLTAPLKTDSSAIKVSYPMYSTRVVNTNYDLAHARNLGNESNFQQNSASKYPPFHPLFTFTPQFPRNFKPSPPPPPPMQPPPLPPRPPPPPFNFYMPSPSSLPPFRPFFPPYINLPPPFPHPPFPPPPHLNHMPYLPPPPR